jgi:TonB family protein
MLVNAVSILKASAAPTKEEISEARQLAETAFNSENALAAYLLAALPGTSEDEAIAWLQKGARAGNSKCKQAAKKITITKMSVSQVLPPYATIMESIAGTRKNPASSPMVPVETPLPEVPYVLRALTVDGNVTLNFTVTEEGKTGEIQIISSTHPLLADIAKAAVGKWKFQPKVEYGVAVKKMINNFKIDYVRAHLKNWTRRRNLKKRIDV